MMTAAFAAWVGRIKGRLTGGRGAARRRPGPPRLEGLEDRACPSAFTPGDYLVALGNYSTGKNTLIEYTPADKVVQSFNIPFPASGQDQARDVTVGQDGRAYVYNGTFSPELAMLDPVTGAWTHTTYSGWSTVANVSYGGLGHSGPYVFASDMNTFGAEAEGIVRFDTVAGTAQRFADTQQYIALNVGLDGNVYALGGAWFDVYDPNTMALLHSVSLLGVIPDARGIAADAAGNVFLSDWGGYVYKVSPAGQLLASLNTNPSQGINNLCNIDLSPSGQIVVGDRFGNVFHTNATFSGLTSFVSGNGIDFADFVPVPPPADHFVVSGFPASATAGVPGSVTVTADDAAGHVLAGYRGTVHFSSSDGQAVLPADYTFTAADAGSHTFTSGVTLKTAGTQSVTAADVGNSAKGSETNITVNPAAASSFRVAGYPSPATAGVAQTVSVTALDPYGNTATGYASTLHFSSSDFYAVLPPDDTLTNGTGSFHVTLKTAGTQSVTTTDTASNSITGSQTGITVNPAAANHLVVTTQPPASVLVNTGFGLAVSAVDPYGNLDTNFGGAVGVALSNNPGGATLGGGTTVNASQGVATFSDLTLDKGGKGYTLQATGAGLNPATTNPFDVGQVTLSSASVLEFRPVGTLVGTLSTTGASGGHTFTYSLVAGTGSTDNALFTISGDRLLTADAFDATHLYRFVRVRSTDENGRTVEAPFTITISDDPKLGWDGHTLSIQGTGSGDTFSFTPGTPQDSITVNGVALAADAASVSTVWFTGGTIRATVNTGGVGPSTATLTSSRATLSGPGYAVTVDGVGPVVMSGRPGDRAYLGGGAGTPETFVGTPAYSYLDFGGGDVRQANGFGVVVAGAAAPSSTAYLYGDAKAGGNIFVTTPTYSYLRGGSSAFFNQVTGFQTVIGAAASPSDQAYVYGSGGNVFVGTPTNSYLYGGGGPWEQAIGFKYLIAVGSGSGNAAYFYGGAAGGNVLVVAPSYAYLSGGGALAYAAGFQTVVGVAGSATDAAYLYGGAGNTLVATSAYAVLNGPGQTAQVSGFGSVYAYSGGGGQAYLYGTMTPADTFVDGGGYAVLFGGGFFDYAGGFASVWANPNAHR